MGIARAAPDDLVFDDRRRWHHRYHPDLLMTGTGKVLQGGPVDWPPGDHVHVWQVITDATGPESAVYLALDGPKPADGVVISWGPHHSWWEEAGQQVREEKVGGAFRWQSDRPGTDAAIGVG